MNIAVFRNVTSFLNYISTNISKKKTFSLLLPCRNLSYCVRLLIVAHFNELIKVKVVPSHVKKTERGYSGIVLPVLIFGTRITCT